MSDVLLSVRGLGKTYRRGLLRRRSTRALDGVSLEVGRGMVFGLLGPNGAGKTTLVKVLLGLVRPSAGQADLFGRPAGHAASRERVGYLPEAHRLPQYLTGRQVLRLFGEMCGSSPRALRPRIDELLAAVEMEADADRKVREYSKGMQQRIGLAQALVHEPELVFLDEPTDGVDPIGRAAIRRIVQELSGRGVTIFINSHLLMEVEMICDQVVIMDRGRIIRAGTLDELTGGFQSVRIRVAELPPDFPLEPAEVGATPHELLAPAGAVDETIDRLRAAGISIRSVEPLRANLEDVFIDVVGSERS